MGKKVSDSVLDNGPQYVKDNVTAMILTDAEPSSRADAIANALVTVPMSSTDITVGDGTPNGRGFVTSEKLDQDVTASGNRGHTSLISAGELMVVTVANVVEPINSGNKVDVLSWSMTVLDPV